ncbi:Relaxase/Mobilisation nuclease domain-containing protein [Ruminococcus flavefaciens]|uniref:Relaxase/mobilization nuclease-like protein n=1 Tax=Ruminococcus flavefaciens TaxID=1265 RepID=A0A315XX49_RUMFL|nr:relaxase/mobilization nuclease-like protein [Ruminococcus flavefaciens]SSA50239.1 Relaxase/Mobilisation nuclease domain-containing protein [Ruminococcus flavefaciens]
MIQSFAPDEVTPEQAMQIGEELCDRYLKGDYQYVIAVHTDKEHTHCHVIFNNTNLYNGLSFTTEHNQGRKSERAWAELREISDKICAEHGLSLIDPKGKGVSHYEDEMQKEGKSWKDKLRNLLREIISYSRSFEEFLKNCTDSGIEYAYTPQNKVKLKFRLSGEGQQRFTRADTLGDEFEPSAITETIDTAQKKAAAKEAMEKFLAARRARRQAELALLNQSSAKSAEPKPTPTPTAQPKPTIAEPTSPKPTESHAPEKKEDVWAGIRGMRDCDKMIADLEAGGITSLDDLRDFFWNVQHPDDHTDELAALDKKIKGVDKLIKMMKQRSQHSATYNEYQGRSAFTQKHFRKKNAAAIDAYEEADKYITEHIKTYYIKGKPPKQSDLEQRLIELKSKYNTLVPEHNAFVRRRTAASQYTRQVRKYLQNKEQQERNRQYQEKKRSQQRKKDTLE